MSAITYEMLREAASAGGPSVLISTTDLAAAAGPHASVAPARFVSGRDAVYAYERRFIDDEPRHTVIIDCTLAADLGPLEETRRLRDRLWVGLQARLGDAIVLNGHPTERLPNTLNVSFVGRVGADVLAALDGVAASTGAACHADSVALSPVLAAMGVPPVVGMGAVRLSLGRMTTEAEVDEIVRRSEPVFGPGA